MLKGQNRKVKGIGRFAGKASCLGLAALGIALACPTCENASALTSEELESGSLTSSVSISFAPSAGSTTLTPTGAAGTSGLISVLANVGVTNSGGYSVYIGSNSANLVGKKNTGVVIPGVSGEVSFDNLQDNTWGYYAGEGSSIPENATYKAISQGQGEVILANNNSRVKNENKTLILGFAAKIDNSIPADTYENQVTLSVVSNPYQLTLMDIENMQEMTTAICENTPDLATKQLKDVRDGKYYWVTKLADKKCWMTQNLDLDLSTEVALTPEDSDVTTSWTPGFDTATEATAETVNANSQTETRSWSLGDVRITNPTIGSRCEYPKNDAVQCPEQFTAYVTPTTANGEGDAHYILGNHYQWNTATAGGVIAEGQATSSICSKGWKLPTSNSVDIDSFNELVKFYSINSDVAKLTSAPLYFVRSGFVHQDITKLFYDAGYTGSPWSSTNVNTENAYGFSFWGDSTIYATGYSGQKNIGQSVRCVAR